MANEYATSAELKATLSLTGQTFADADITLALTAASRAIDNLANRWFYPVGPGDRYYSPDHPRVLPVDDIITLTALVVDANGDNTYEQTWTENTHFVLEPLNAAANGVPQSVVCVHPRGGRLFPTYHPRSVKLTGTFGWASAPEPVKEATVILASKLMRRAREAPFGVITAGMDGIAVRIGRTDPDIAMLVEPYVRDAVMIV